SYCTPAALNAFSRYLRSAVSQRTDDFESGRITPTLPEAAPPPPAAVVVAPLAVVVAPPPAAAAVVGPPRAAVVVAPPLLLLLLSLPQAAMPSENTVAATAAPNTDFRIRRSFLSRPVTRNLAGCERRRTRPVATCDRISPPARSLTVNVAY